MTCSFPMLNWDKIEVILLGPEHLRDQLSGDVVSVDGIALASNTTVKNLVVVFDRDLSFNPHVKQISRAEFFHHLKKEAIPDSLPLLPASSPWPLTQWPCRLCASCLKDLASLVWPLLQCFVRWPPASVALPPAVARLSPSVSRIVEIWIVVHAYN